MSSVRVAVLAVLCATGCATAGKRVEFQGLAPAAFVKDQTPPDSYPGFLAAEGNIYSCRYGIHHMSKSRFAPPKADAFGALLAKYVPGVEQHDVVLQRFDVYYNWRLKALHAAAPAVGGAVGGALGGALAASIEDASKRNEKNFTFKDLVLDLDPTRPKAKDVNMVGCDDRQEGEYDPSLISGGHDVIVSWLRFTIDGTEYHLRSFYQFQPEKPEDVNSAATLAVERTVEAVSSAIKL